MSAALTSKPPTEGIIEIPTAFAFGEPTFSMNVLTFEEASAVLNTLRFEAASGVTSNIGGNVETRSASEGSHPYLFIDFGQRAFGMVSGTASICSPFRGHPTIGAERPVALIVDSHSPYVSERQIYNRNPTIAGGAVYRSLAERAADPVLRNQWPESERRTSETPHGSRRFETSRQISPLQAKLDALCSEGDGRNVRAATVTCASELLSSLPTDISAPHMSSTPDGEIALFWFGGGNRVEAYIDEERHLTWIGKFGGVFDRGGDVEWSGQIPPEFLGMLSRLKT